MHLNKKFWVALFTLTSFLALAQKASLTQDSYNEWNRFSDVELSPDGVYLMYITTVQKGNSNLTLYNTTTGVEQIFPRVSKAEFSPDGSLLAMTRVADYDSVRALKLVDAGKDEFPPDTLLIWEIEANMMDTVVGISRYAFADEKPELMVYQYEEYIEEEEEDTTLTDADTSAVTDSTEAAEAPDRGKILVIRNSADGSNTEFDHTDEFHLPEKAEWIYLSFDEEDTTKVNGYYGIRLSDRELLPVDTGAEDYSGVAMDSTGRHFVVCKTMDDEDKDYDRSYSLALYSDAEFVDQLDSGSYSDYMIHSGASIFFDEERNGFYFGMQSPPPYFPTDTTILDDEIVSVDIWNWKDGHIQPYQKENARRLANQHFLFFYDWKNNSATPLANKDVPDAMAYSDVPGRYTLASADDNYLVERSWTYPWRTDYYRVDRKTGQHELIVEGTGGYLQLSPAGKYAYWYEPFDSTWNIYNLKKQEGIRVVHPDGYGFYDRENDVPSPAYQYGDMGWTVDDEAFWIYDEFDIYRVDPTGKSDVACITENYGRENNIKIRFSEYDRERDYFEVGEELLVTLFHTENKSSGYALWNGSGAPEALVLDAFDFGRLRKAEQADVFVYTKESFQMFPDLYLANDRPSKEDKRITDINPQQSEYLWGTVEMVEWRNLRGEVMRGMLYKPENFDPNQKYPMITYFYEKYTDRFHNYYTPAPSRSIVNFSYLVSNGYLVFVPDITYTVGHPGKDAYDCIVPGVNHIVDMGFVDEDRIGIQGQSWGGYQTAFLVTQTDMFAAAFAGAPVSNMTSAYGGIRWGSGLNRAFQYEAGQSRIGYNLWERPEWYIENSPLFFADRVNTPLLIMHNDNDGAVPWYQGIEYFMALRRLGKPTWLLVYNGEEHNLMQWHNRMDLDRRMYQFFDHYLKDKPAPKWLSEGVPYRYKKKDYGFETEN